MAPKMAEETPITVYWWGFVSALRGLECWIGGREKRGDFTDGSFCVGAVFEDEEHADGQETAADDQNGEAKRNGEDVVVGVDCDAWDA